MKRLLLLAGITMLLISPYTSLPDVGAQQFAWPPISLLMRDRFETEAKAGGIPHPVVIVHGEAEALIPVTMGDSAW